MTAKHPFRLAMSPLTKTIYAGRVRQRDGYAEPAGPRHDVTNDFYGCLIQMTGENGGTFTIRAAGVPAYVVTIKKLEQQ